MSGNANKLLAGALLAGMGIVTGEATLLATAGGVGVNWLAEGLASLWPALVGRPSDPLARAYAAAMRDGVKTLEADYRRTVDPRAGSELFQLIADCAEEVAAAQFPDGVNSVDAAQAVLEASLTALLHGHDPRQADYLRQRLLPACAAAFQKQLVQDAAAWRAFHGLILQALAANSASLLAKLDGFAQVLAAWSDPNASLAQLQRIEAQLAELAARPAAKPQFDNRGMRVGGNVYQAGRDQYFHSAHAESGGTAIVTNIIGAPPGTTPAAAPPAPGAALLFLAANPRGTPPLRLDQEARGVDAALRQARHGARFHLEQQWAVRSTDLLDILLRGRPAIVHFAGHGDATGHLILEDAAGRPAPIAPGTLAALLAAPASVRCVLLNACWSDALAGALLGVTACVVGMSAEAPDAAAIAFAAGFYRALADGESVGAAVMTGRAQVQAEQGAGAALAVELRAAAGVDPSAVRFI